MSIDRARFLPDLVVEGASILPARNLAGEVATTQELLDALALGVHILPDNFGAKGDWTGADGTDDTAALQAWLDFGKNFGVPLSCRTGARYRITAMLVVENVDHFYLNGCNAQIVYDMGGRDESFLLQAVNNIVIENLRIDGRKALRAVEQTEGHGITFRGCKNVKIDKCTIERSHEHALANYSINADFVGEDPADRITNENFIVTGCTFIDCGNIEMGRGAAIWSYGYVNHIVYSGNIVRGCVGGLAIDDHHTPSGPKRISQKIAVIGNICETYRWGMYFESSSYGTITGNQFYVDDPADSSPATRGVAIAALLLRSIQQSPDPAQFVEITCNIFQSTQYAVWLDYVADANFADNVCIQNNPNNIDYSLSSQISSPWASMAGIKFNTRADGGTYVLRDLSIDTNRIISQSHGIHITYGSGVLRFKDVDVTNNKIRCTSDMATAIAQSLYGIYAGNTDEFVVRGNKAAGYGIGIRMFAGGMTTGSLFLVEQNVLRDNNIALSVGNLVGGVIRHNYTLRSLANGLSLDGSSGGTSDIPEIDFSGNYSLGDFNNNAPVNWRITFRNIGNRGFNSFTTAQFLDATHKVNTVGKFGARYRNSTTNVFMYATGSGPTAAWTSEDRASADLTPV